jgi:flagellar biosynthesis GTPase FlhF
MNDNAFVFYLEYESQLSRLSDEQLGKLIRAIIEYKKTGEPCDSGDIAVDLSFDFIKVDIDKQAENYRKKADAGRLGGSKNKQNETDESNAKQNEANESKSNHKKEKEKEIEKDTEKESSPKGEQKKDAPRMVRPTVEEVSAYCRERGNTVDAQHFVDFYQSKGWKVGTQPMKDWRACVRTWEQREKPRAGNRFTSGLIASDYSGIREEDLIAN